MENDSTEQSKRERTYIRIRRRPFFLGLTVVVLLPFAVWLWKQWSFALSNWPPHYGSHKVYIKNLGCDAKGLASYIVTEEQLHGEGQEHGYHPVGYDRRIFFEKPACIGAIVFWGEYGGPQQRIGFYDMDKKQRTIEMELTHISDHNKWAQNQ